MVVPKVLQAAVESADVGGGLNPTVLRIVAAKMAAVQENETVVPESIEGICRACQDGSLRFSLVFFTVVPDLVPLKLRLTVVLASESWPKDERRASLFDGPSAADIALLRATAKAMGERHNRLYPIRVADTRAEKLLP